MLDIGVKSDGLWINLRCRDGSQEVASELIGRYLVEFDELAGEVMSIMEG